jgi:hypothetical protein
MHNLFHTRNSITLVGAPVLRFSGSVPLFVIRTPTLFIGCHGSWLVALHQARIRKVSARTVKFGTTTSTGAYREVKKPTVIIISDFSTVNLEEYMIDKLRLSQ